ncbi:serine/threonine protein kinase, CMGC, CDC2/CDK sub [Tilletia horrida]|nr:serine/threonine protein kinase, CMGC, CDC2/CDK sub [Tilletia horrida]
MEQRLVAALAEVSAYKETTAVAEKKRGRLKAEIADLTRKSKTTHNCSFCQQCSVCKACFVAKEREAIGLTRDVGSKDLLAEVREEERKVMKKNLDQAEAKTKSLEREVAELKRRLETAEGSNTGRDDQVHRTEMRMHASRRMWLQTTSAVGTSAGGRRWVKGGYGAVYARKHHLTGSVFAVKRIDVTEAKVGHSPSETRVAVREDVFREMSVYDTFRKTQDARRFSNLVDLILETDGSRIFDGEVCDESHIQETANINHLDLKPENILVDDQGHLKITDFGLSDRRGNTNLLLYYIMLCTVWYRPPEVFLRRGLYDIVDLWSFDVIVLELWTGKVPCVTMSFNRAWSLDIFEAILNHVGADVPLFPGAEDCPGVWTGKEADCSVRAKGPRGKTRFQQRPCTLFKSGPPPNRTATEMDISQR